jgi:hypothetical protein
MTRGVAAKAARGLGVVLLSAVAVGISTPPASADSDTTAPTAPSVAGTVHDIRCTGLRFVHWRADSIDNIDARTDIRYRFFDTDGKPITFPTWGTDLPGDSVQMDSWSRGFDPAIVPVTVRAVDQAGNLSAPTSVTNEGRV